MIPLIEPKKEIPYGKFYLGVVTDNNDPKQLGRIKVMIPLYEGIPVNKVPWALRFGDIVSGSSNQAGSFSVPDLNSTVVVFFPFLDPHQPVYLGNITNQQTQLSDFLSDYPDTYGFRDKIGNIFRVNKIQQTTEYIHPSGTKILISNDGSVTIDIANDITWNVAGNWTANIGGNVNWNHGG